MRAGRTKKRLETDARVHVKGTEVVSNWLEWREDGGAKVVLAFEGMELRKAATPQMFTADQEESSASRKGYPG